jgi:hypothetical protein
MSDPDYDIDSTKKNLDYLADMIDKEPESDEKHLLESELNILY